MVSLFQNWITYNTDNTGTLSRNKESDEMDV